MTTLSRAWLPSSDGCWTQRQGAALNMASVWMKFTLPTQHVLYFGIQAKKGQLDASGVSKCRKNVNVGKLIIRPR